jgi:hypothetical protein
MPTILIDPADFDSIISYLGVTIKDLTYADIQSTGFLESAEAFITQRLNAQAGPGCERTDCSANNDYPAD